MAYAKRDGVKIREITRAKWPNEWRESYNSLSSVPCTLHGAQVGEACFQLPKRLTSFGWPRLFCMERGEAVDEIKKRKDPAGRNRERDNGNEPLAFSPRTKPARWLTTE